MKGGEAMSYTLDWKEYTARAVQTAAEGCVLLENRDHALPLTEGEACAVFGRIQNYYYKSGTGSGGMVNTPYVHSIVDGLRAAQGITVDEELAGIYRDWEKKNPVDRGKGWGTEPWCQKEMPLSEELAEKCAQRNDAAVIVIGRTAGEDQDNKAEAGSYYLTDGEKAMLETVCRHFERSIVVLNVGNVIDMSWVKEYHPAAVLYVWQGGMEGGMGAAAVLTGKENPSGKLADTIAESIHDYPSDTNFYEGDELLYQEDVYVGYRYFETAAKEKVLYPFGFGLSYTDFFVSVSMEEKKEKIVFSAFVKNTGSMAGKEVVQIYLNPPQGKLGNPVRRLAAFEKTPLLQPGEETVLTMTVKKEELASYDDSGKTGYPWCYVLEEGRYAFYAGTDVRSSSFIGSFVQEETAVTQQCSQCMAPVRPFARMKPAVREDGSWSFEWEAVPLRTGKREEPKPECLPYSGDRGWKLADVYEKRVGLDAFIAQIPDKNLCEMVRGEGMSSPRVTPGTAAAFGGVSDALADFGIPAGCCTDGPSGMRLDSGTNAFSLPNGTLLACTFNRELTADLFEMEGLEMRNNRIDSLLGPGMNIHRHPLNGRNFEYLSEDPLLTGEIAAAQLIGMARAGVTGTIKHFCANNREFHRRTVNSVVSERALREIYLKGFEIAVKKGKAYSIMTTYGAVNGIWTAGSYDQNTRILREEWGFDGIVMTDWWADINEEGKKQSVDQLAAMVHAQNDLYMVTKDPASNKDDLEKALSSGKLTRAELVRSAKNILGVLMRSPVMERWLGREEKVEIINAPDAQELTSDFDVAYYPVSGRTVIPLKDIPHSSGDSWMCGIVTQTMGDMTVTLTASSAFDELAQMPVTLFLDNKLFGTYTFHGTNGETASISRNGSIFDFRHYLKLHFAQGGLDIKEMIIEMKNE